MLGFLISILTFPGVIVHEYAHYKMCLWRDVPVQEVVFFQFGSPAGYVLHDEPNGYVDALAIAGAPFLINTVLAVVLFGLFALFESSFGPSPSSVSALYYAGIAVLWLGMSVGMHSIPSSGDAAYLWEHAKAHWRDSLLGMLGFPIAGLVYLANLLSFLWFDVFYAAGLAFFTAMALRMAGLG